MSKTIQLFAIALLCAISSCILDIKPTVPPLTVSRVGSAKDTVSIFETICLGFSAPLSDTAVSITFAPSFFDYYTQLNQQRDTLTIRITGALEPNTSYTVGFAKPVTSLAGSSIFPGDRQFTIRTSAQEAEPNNSAAAADSCFTTISGTVSSASDTDFFIMPATVRRIVVTAINTEVLVAIVSDSFASAIPFVTYNTTDTLPVGAPVAASFYCKVFTRIRVADSKYTVTGIQ